MLSTNRILALLRVSLHVLVALLLAVGVVGQLRSDASGLALPATFAAVYMAGTVWHNRGKAYPVWAGYAWLALVAALWAAMALRCASYVWLEFPLAMLACVILPVGWDVLAAAGLLAVTLAFTVPASGVGGVVGPAIGTVLAVFIVRGYQALRAETEHYRQMAADLETAQFERSAAEHVAENAANADASAGADREPLPARLARLARSAEDRQRALGDELTVRVDAVDLPEPVASVAERVVREGLSNIVRHAGASEAVVTVDRLGGTATIDVYDNGRGITGPEGYGLQGLRARVEEAGGELTVEGNVLAATLPVEEK